MMHTLDGEESHNRARSMDCRQVMDLLVAYLDGEVGAAERSAMEAHLAGCEKCRRERDSLRTAQNALRTAFNSKARSVDPPERAWEELQPGLNVYRPSLLFLFRRRRWRIVATVIIVVVTAVALLWASGIWFRSP
jgi:anti-sigma factor (TIGR02949 family)